MSLEYIGGKPVVMPTFIGERARRQEIYSKEDAANALQEGPADLARVVGIMGDAAGSGQAGAAADHDSEIYDPSTSTGPDNPAATADPDLAPSELPPGIPRPTIVADA